jgi:hypothetical protein
MNQCNCGEFYKCYRCGTYEIWKGLPEDKKIAAISLARAINKGADIKPHVRRANELGIDVAMIPEDIFIRC